MNMRRLLFVSTIAMLTLVPSFLLTSCESEDSPDTEGLDSYFDEHPYVSDPRSGTYSSVVSISPDSAEISSVGQKIAFTASGGRGVYTWDVSSTANGDIDVTGDETAIYTASVVGPNDVIVYDEDGQAAVASITGPASSLLATANPDELDTDKDMSVLTASGGVAPYTWEVSDNIVGHLLSNTGSSVVYQRGAKGDNSVTVTDSAGETYSVVIRQP